MKKIFITLFIVTLSVHSMAQTCEEREDNLLSAIGGLAAAFVYNTYTTIGAISDGFHKDIYTKEITSKLAVEQENLIETARKLMVDLIDKKSLKDKDDEEYIKEMSDLMIGLKKQAKLLNEYTKNKSTSAAENFEAQRKSNWAKISELLGLDEK